MNATVYSTYLISKMMRAIATGDAWISFQGLHCRIVPWAGDGEPPGFVGYEPWEAVGATHRGHWCVFEKKNGALTIVRLMEDSHTRRRKFEFLQGPPTPFFGESTSVVAIIAQVIGPSEELRDLSQLAGALNALGLDAAADVAKGYVRTREGGLAQLALADCLASVRHEDPHVEEYGLELIERFFSQGNWREMVDFYTVE